MPSSFYAEGGKTYLAETICRRHTNEVVCSACPPSIRRIFSSGFNLDSAGKKARSGLPRRAFACKRCSRRLTVTRYLSLAFGVLDTASISTCIALVLRDCSSDSTTQRTLSGLLSRLADVEPTKALESLDTSETLEAIDTPSTLTARHPTSPKRASTAQRLPLVPIDHSAYLTPAHSTSKKRLSVEGESAGERSTPTTGFYKRPRLQIEDRPSRPSLTLPSVSIPSATLNRLPSRLSDDLTKVFSALRELSAGLVGYFPASSPEKDCSPEKGFSPEIDSDTTILYSPIAEPRPYEALSSPISEPAFDDPPSLRGKRASFLSSPSPAPKGEPSLLVEGERLVLPEPCSVPFPIADPTITTPLTTSAPSEPLQTATTPQNLLLATTEPCEASAGIVSDLLTRFDRARDSRERGAVWKEVRRLKLTSAFAIARAERCRDGRDGETLACRARGETSEETA